MLQVIVFGLFLVLAGGEGIVVVCVGVGLVGGCVDLELADILAQGGGGLVGGGRRRRIGGPVGASALHNGLVGGGLVCGGSGVGGRGCICCIGVMRVGLCAGTTLQEYGIMSRFRLR